MKQFISLVCALLILSQVFATEETSGSRVLALLSDLGFKNSHSIFFRTLEDKFKVDYFKADDLSVKLKKYGEWQYDHIVLFSPVGDETAAVDAATLVEFVDSGKNVFVATDSRVGKLTRAFATECNVEFDKPGAFAVDHFHFDSSDFDGPHNLLVAKPESGLGAIFGKDYQSRAPVLYRGAALDILEDADVLYPVLRGSATSFSAGNSDTLHVAGTHTTLVASLQARNNARVVISGSTDIYSDKFFNMGVQENAQKQKFEKSGNEEFAKSLLLWTFGEKGVLRVKSVSHHRVNETESADVYTIKEMMEYKIEIEEFTGRRWAPFVADDVQMEFIMLDPYVITTLKSDGKGSFTSVFQLPDVYGFFTFKVEYSRKGYSHLNSITRVPVRPFRHTQYERFIHAAYPYYAGSLSMLIGLFLFSWVFMNLKDN